MKKLTQRQLLKICDRNVRKLKKTERNFNEQSYRRGFFGRTTNKDSTK